MASNTASQITTALTSLLANIRSRWILRFAAVAALALTAIDGGTLRAQQPPQISDSSLAQDGGPQAGSFLLTIFLKHDESKTLDQINAQLKAQGFC